MLNEPHAVVLKVGPHATRIVEPRQARKGATVRRPSRVPWEYLTGAGCVRKSQDGSFRGGCTIILFGVGAPSQGDVQSLKGSARSGTLLGSHRGSTVGRIAREAHDG